MIYEKRTGCYLSVFFVSGYIRNQIPIERRDRLHLSAPAPKKCIEFQINVGTGRDLCVPVNKYV